MKLLKRILTTTSILAFATPSFANCPADFFNNLGKHEGDYDTVHASKAQGGLDSTSVTAIGKYGIIMGNWKNAGFVTSGNTWNTAQFSPEIQAQYGVTNVDQLRNTPGGHALQDHMASGLLIDSYNSMNSTAKGYSGQTISTPEGVTMTLNDAMLLRGSWFFGASDFNKWANSGFTADGLRALDTDGDILEYNCHPSNCTGYADLARNQLKTWQSFANTDISCVTNSEFTQGAFAQGDYSSCDPEVGNFLAKAGQKKVEETVVAAQDQTLGISQAEESYDMMSCVDFAFQGSFDTLFNVPDFGSIAGVLNGGLGGIVDGLKGGIQGALDPNALSQFACQTLKNMTGNAMSQVTGSLNNLTGEMTQGFGPLSGLASVDIGFNPNGNTGDSKIGVNVGVNKFDPLQGQFNQLFNGVNQKIGDLNSSAGGTILPYVTVPSSGSTNTAPVNTGSTRNFLGLGQ